MSDFIETNTEKENSKEQPGSLGIIKCELHPNFKVGALYVHIATGALNLLCIKCIIDGDCFKQSDDYKLVKIKKLVQIYSDPIPE